MNIVYLYLINYTKLSVFDFILSFSSFIIIKASIYKTL